MRRRACQSIKAFDPSEAEIWPEGTYILIDLYGNNMKAKKGEVDGKAVIDGIRCREEWSVAKKLVLEQRYPMDSTQVLWRLLN